MSAKKRLSLMDVIQIEHTVDISPDEEMVIRPLTLGEMLNLLINYQEPFLSLYNQSMNASTGALDFSSFIISAPELVARIIAFSSNPQNEEELIAAQEGVRKGMAGTVQLIALKAIWDLSVPDPKKAGQLLLEVTAQLRRLQEKAKIPSSPEQESSPTVSPQP